MLSFTRSIIALCALVAVLSCRKNIALHAQELRFRALMGQVGLEPDRYLVWLGYADLPEGIHGTCYVVSGLPFGAILMDNDLEGRMGLYTESALIHEFAHCLLGVWEHDPSISKIMNERVWLPASRDELRFEELRLLDNVRRSRE